MNEVKDLEGVAVLQDNLDLTPLLSLKKLKRLNCHTPTSAFDLATFTDLKVLGITYNKYVGNIASCKNLTWLWIDNLKQDDLSCLSSLTNLTKLNLFKTGITSLQGIEPLNKLQFLNIDTANQLQSLEGLTQNNSSLEVLSVYNAPKLTDYKPLENLANLKKLFLGKTGDMENLDFVNKTAKLEEVNLGIRVADGNMTNLRSVKKVALLTSLIIT